MIQGYIKMMKDILGKGISSRARIHMPHGMIGALLMGVPCIVTKGNLAYTLAGCVMGIAWLAALCIPYQLSEHKRINDGADLDIFGIKMGFIAGVLACIALYTKNGSLSLLVDSIKNSVITNKTPIGMSVTGVAGYLIKSFLENRKKLLEKK